MNFVITVKFQTVSFMILGKEEPNMIVIMKPMTEQKEIDKLAESLMAQGVEVNPVYGTDLTICLLYTSPSPRD